MARLGWAEELDQLNQIADKLSRWANKELYIKPLQVAEGTKEDADER